MKEDVAAILQKSPLGRGLTKEDIDEILKDKSTQIKTYEKGNTIFMEGEKPSKIFLLVKGNIGVLKGTFSGKRILITNIEHPGELFGEVFLFMEKPIYEMQAEALEKSVVLELQNENFKESSATGSRIEELLRGNLMSVFAMKAYRLSSKVRVLGCTSIREKIAVYLTEHQGKDGSLKNIPSREEMADYLSVTRPSLSRELGNMAKEGIIKMDGREIVITDQDMLEEYL